MSLFRKEMSGARSSGSPGEGAAGGSPDGHKIPRLNDCGPPEPAGAGGSRQDPELRDPTSKASADNAYYVE